MTTRVELLLFDLGGVLVDFSGPRDLGPFLRTPASPDEVLKRWIQCPHTTDFEAGRISAREWAERFVCEWEVNLAPEKFLAEFCSWSRGFLPGAQELLKALRPRYRLGALSNSNEMHRARNADQPANVAAALSCGIRAFQVEGVAGLREYLVNERLLLS